MPIVSEERTSECAQQSTAGRLTAQLLIVRVLELRRRLASVCVVCAGVAVAFIMWQGRTYTSHVSFLPASSDASMSALAGLASQVGLAVGTGQGQDSPDFYVDFLSSDQLLGRLALGRYPVRARGGSVADTTLLDYLQVGSGDSAARVATAIKVLRAHLRASSSATSGVVTLLSTFDDGYLAQAVAARALALVNEFNVASRQTQAGAQRRFLGTQVSGTGTQLRMAEDSMLAFLVRNRNYASSPTLQFQFERLQRSVTMRQAAYTQSFQSFLQAQAAEAQNTPVISVVEQPEVPGLPDPRHLPIKVLLVVVLAAGAVLLGALLEEWWHGQLKANPRLLALASAAATELARIIPGRRPS